MKYWVLLVTGCFILYTNIYWLYSGEIGCLRSLAGILLLMALLWLFRKEKQQ